jgi:hypothetical protein
MTPGSCSRSAMREIDRQRSGQEPADRLDLPARFEDEAAMPGR